MYFLNYVKRVFKRVFQFCFEVNPTHSMKDASKLKNLNHKSQITVTKQQNGRIAKQHGGLYPQNIMIIGTWSWLTTLFAGNKLPWL